MLTTTRDKKVAGINCVKPETPSVCSKKEFMGLYLFEDDDDIQVWRPLYAMPDNMTRILYAPDEDLALYKLDRMVRQKQDPRYTSRILEAGFCPGSDSKPSYGFTSRISFAPRERLWLALKRDLVVTGETSMDEIQRLTTRDGPVFVSQDRLRAIIGVDGGETEIKEKLDQLGFTSQARTNMSSWELESRHMVVNYKPKRVSSRKKKAKRSIIQDRMRGELHEDIEHDLAVHMTIRGKDLPRWAKSVVTPRQAPEVRTYNGRRTGVNLLTLSDARNSIRVSRALKFEDRYYWRSSCFSRYAAQLMDRDKHRSFGSTLEHALLYLHGIEDRIERDLGKLETRARRLYPSWLMDEMNEVDVEHGVDPRGLKNWFMDEEEYVRAFMDMYANSLSDIDELTWLSKFLRREARALGIRLPKHPLHGSKHKKGGR